ncbi:extracellular solute-binding protein [Halomicrobium urmianum]|uniref:extracellular solute-binding protein n=1 Tax=Halomicrobium urmianum TaxID=1586233 RepID=UPI001CD94DE5|nr:extracellular solute-binding protein [Halomicrobium urmianum]
MSEERTPRNRYRRSFLKASGVGLLGGLAGCTRGGSGDGASGDGGNGSDGTGSTSTDGSSGDELVVPLSEYEDADIEWRQFEGSEVNVLAPQHTWVDMVEPAIPVFEELTGMSVNINTFPEQQFRTKRLTDLNTGAGEYDAFWNVRTVNQYREAGWLEPLDQFFEDDSLYDGDWYDREDIFETVRWRCHADGQWDKWSGLPLNTEVQVQFYRTDLYDEYGLEVAETTEQFVENARTIHENESDVVGAVGRGQKGYGMNVYVLNTFVQEFGADIWDSKPDDSGLDSAEAVEAAQFYVDVLQEYGPDGAGSQTWNDVLSTMQSGRAGHIVSDANLFWPGLTDPEASDVADTVGVAPVPYPEGGSLGPNQSTWQMNTSKFADNSAEAFLFMIWATSKPTNNWMHLDQGAGFSVRQGIWENDDFRSRVGETFADATIKSQQAADPISFDRHYPEWGQLYSEEVQLAISGDKSPQEAMEAAAKAAEDTF